MAAHISLQVKAEAHSMKTLLQSQLSNFDHYDAWVLAGGSLFRAHSYVLAAHSPYLRTAITAVGEPRIVLPHITATGFAAALAYMYTGKLSINQCSLYEIMITGNLLQMTNLVTLIQTLLTAPTTSVSPKIINPAIGDRDRTKSPQTVLPPALNAWRNLTRFVPSPSLVSTLKNTTLIKPTPVRPIINQELQETENELRGSREEVQRYIITSGMERARKKITETPNGPNACVIDIAACDGPVFFERVLNKSFKSLGSDTDTSETDDDREINVVDPDEMPLSNQMSISRVDFDSKNNASRTYHCLYCNTNFKSHYCYQKHMRRHINPITVEGELPDQGTTSDNPGSTLTEGTTKILDLNVQYFPCKTCGSKFPSYYFVHKHRRMCHTDEDKTQDNCPETLNSQSSEMQPKELSKSD